MMTHLPLIVILLVLVSFNLVALADADSLETYKQACALGVIAA